MKYYLKEEFLHDHSAKNAGTKARNDVEEILMDEGYKPLLLSVQNWYEMSFFKAQRHKVKALQKSLEQLKANDELLLQFPMLHHSFFTGRLIRQVQKRGIKVYVLVHDLEVLRYANVANIPIKHRLRLQLQEMGLLSIADGVIAHNPVMKSVLMEKGIAENKLVSLNIFDYLIPDFQDKKELKKSAPIIVAGNLANEKAGYLYSLPASPIYNLYGVGFDETRALANETYLGSFHPDELPSVLEGSFGLVWDGDSAATCSGVFGDYLRYNNSHKTSLYLAAGFPVIVWKESALSTFVLEHQCGIAVASLDDIDSEIERLTDSDYQHLVNQARTVGAQIREGQYLKSALTQLERIA